MQTEDLMSVPQTCWWNPFGSQPLTTESLAVKSSVSFAGANPETEQALDKQSLFTLSNGGVKSSRDVSTQNVAFTMQSACFEFGIPQPTIYTKHPHVEQYYGVVSAYGTQIPSGRVMIPLKMETEEDCTIYVNSKQYNGIIRRRQSRAKAALKNKQSKCRKQPYMHHSRHLHAMRRPRGSGGRFLNTKEADAAKLCKPTNSQNSEVLHPENRTMDSSREANMLNFSGSEVTSMDYFLGSSVHSLGGMDMPRKWIAAAMDISCCNLKS